MATLERNIATPADETLLDTMAADHVSHMSRRVQQLASHGDAKDRREPAASSSPPETTNDSPDAVVGAFEGDSGTSRKNAAPIIVDLPLHVSAVDTASDQSDADDSTYQATIEPEKNLAEEILSQQMADEMELAAPVTFESETIREEDETPESPPPAEPIEMMAKQVASVTPAPVRPRPTIGAIRPPAQPSRIRSILIQALIVLLALTAVAMLAYLMGIL